jgi:hypothetical protein
MNAYRQHDLTLAQVDFQRYTVVRLDTARDPATGATIDVLNDAMDHARIETVVRYELLFRSANTESMSVPNNNFFNTVFRR